MRVPVPKNRLVVLTVLGAVLVAVVSVGLAEPGLLRPDSFGSDHAPAAVAGDSPTADQQTGPAAVAGSEDDHARHEEHEERDDHEGGEDD